MRVVIIENNLLGYSHLKEEKNIEETSRIEFSKYTKSLLHDCSLNSIRFTNVRLLAAPGELGVLTL